MPIQDQIDSIIKRRQTFKDEFEGYYRDVKRYLELVNSIYALNTHGWTSLLASNEKLRSEWEATIDDVEKLKQKLLSLCDGDKGLLMECLKRVRRDFVNVGCIGPWRQGKSTVIAKLTQLSDYIIPRSQFLNCTGTTINVFNGNQIVWENGAYVEKDGDKAVVYYHSFKSVCQLINEYLKKLGFDEMPCANNKDSMVRICTDYYKKIQGRPTDGDSNIRGLRVDRGTRSI